MSGVLNLLGLQVGQYPFSGQTLHSHRFGMLNAAISQLAHHIKVPNYKSSGLSDSKVPDSQAGWEKAITSILAAMGGSNYIHHSAGMLESMLTMAMKTFADAG
jgi:trimethylamine:corrinoid methyltransferase-like protein